MAEKWVEAPFLCQYGLIELDVVVPLGEPTEGVSTFPRSGPPEVKIPPSKNGGGLSTICGGSGAAPPQSLDTR